MMGLMQRNKGKVWERKVAQRFRDVLPGVGIKRGWQTRNGADAPDVDVPTLWPECKHQRKCSPAAALRQAQTAEGAAGGGRIPIAVCKDNGQDPFVVLDFDDFLELFGQWWATRTQ